ncbi:MAG: hypothetical protein WBE50_03465, partial [Methyloceanibacter sp.]
MLDQVVDVNKVIVCGFLELISVYGQVPSPGAVALIYPCAPAVMWGSQQGVQPYCKSDPAASSAFFT